MSTYLTGWDDKGRRSYDIAGEYADDKVDDLLAALHENTLTVRVELHHHRLGSNQSVKLFIPATQANVGQVDAHVRKLVDKHLL